MDYRAVYIPYRAMVDRFGPWQISSALLGTARDQPGIGVMVQSTAQPSRVLMVLGSQARLAECTIQIRLAAPTGSLCLDGNPQVYMNLSRTQALELLRGGIPDAIDVELNSAADKAGWSALGAGGTVMKPPIKIDAGQFFDS
jgi:hypothetical protein